MSERIEHLDEGMIHAWLDGALSPDESARMESHANACADCGALVAEARGLVAASSRILSSLDAVPAGVIPGSGVVTDQLAALRARRAADSRRWWRDRRFVAAASLVLVAGVSSVVWRTAGDQSPVAMEFTRAVDTVIPPAAAPSPGPAEVTQPLRDAAPVRAATLPADSTRANAKVAARGPVPVAAELTAESRVAGAAGQQTKAVANAARAEQSTNVQRQVQQQDAAAPQRLAVEQQRADSTRAAAAAPTAASPPPAAAALSRNRGAAALATSGVSIPVITRPAGSCFELRRVLGENRYSADADTVRLLDEAVPERSDPSWRRAQYEGVPPDAALLSWRQVDSATVELRAQSATDSSVVRFLSLGDPPRLGGRQLVLRLVPEVRSLPGVQAAAATRVECR